MKCQSTEEPTDDHVIAADSGHKSAKIEDGTERPGESLKANGMSWRSIFTYDVFLSHRVGDGARHLRGALANAGCSVWFDNDVPLTDRRIFPLVRDAFLNSRSVLAFLSSSHEPSPWTMLEMIAALKSESADARRLLFFVEDAVDIGAFPMPDELRAAAAQRPLFSWGSLDRLCVELLERNRIPACAHADLVRADAGDMEHQLENTRRRSVARLRDMIPAYEASLERRKHDFRKDRGVVAPLETDVLDPVEAARFRVDCAKKIVGDDDDTWNHVGLGLEFMNLRNLEQHMARGKMHADVDIDFIRSIAATRAASANTDDRANAFYLLHAISAGYGDMRSTRLLRRYLRREPEQAVAKLFNSESENGGKWWPERLIGVENSLLSERNVNGKMRIGWSDCIHPDVRIAFRETKYEFMEHSLPEAHQLKLSVHWLNMLIDHIESHVSASGCSDSGAPALNGKIDLGTLEIELVFRELHKSVEKMLCKRDDREFHRNIESVSTAFRRLVEISEYLDGYPLNTLTEFFSPFALDILGSMMLLTDHVEAASTARRAITVISPRIPRGSAAYFGIFIDKCVEWRESGRVGFGEGAPLEFNEEHGFFETPAKMLALAFRLHKSLDKDR